MHRVNPCFTRILMYNSTAADWGPKLLHVWERCTPLIVIRLLSRQGLRFSCGLLQPCLLCISIECCLLCILYIFCGTLLAITVKKINLWRWRLDRSRNRCYIIKSFQNLFPVFVTSCRMLSVFMRFVFMSLIQKLCIHIYSSIDLYSNTMRWYAKLIS